MPFAFQLALLVSMFASMLVPTTATVVSASEHGRRQRRQHHEVSQQLMDQRVEDTMVDAGDMLAAEGTVVPSAAVDAAGASAEAFVKAAEQEVAASEAEKVAPEPAPHAAAKHVKGLSLATAHLRAHRKHAHGENASSPEEDAGDDQEDDTDDDDDDTAAQPAVATTVAPKPGDVLESVAAAPTHGDVLESYTPEGRYARARQLLQENLKQQAEHAAFIAYLSNNTAYETRVNLEADQVAAQSNATHLAAMLGTVRKEMHKFATPFYLQYLASEQQRLQAEVPQLQADVEAAQAALAGGSNMESRFLGPARGNIDAPPPVQPQTPEPVPNRAIVTIGRSSAPSMLRPDVSLLLLACAMMFEAMIRA